MSSIPTYRPCDDSGPGTYQECSNLNGQYGVRVTGTSGWPTNKTEVYFNGTPDSMKTLHCWSYYNNAPWNMPCDIVQIPGDVFDAQGNLNNNFVHLADNMDVGNFPDTTKTYEVVAWDGYASTSAVYALIDGSQPLECDAYTFPNSAISADMKCYYRDPSGNTPTPSGGDNTITPPITPVPTTSGGQTITPNPTNSATTAPASKFKTWEIILIVVSVIILIMIIIGLIIYFATRKPKVEIK